MYLVFFSHQTPEGAFTASIAINCKQVKSPLEIIDNQDSEYDNILFLILKPTTVQTRKSELRG